MTSIRFVLVGEVQDLRTTITDLSIEEEDHRTVYLNIVVNTVQDSQRDLVVSKSTTPETLFTI